MKKSLIVAIVCVIWALIHSIGLYHSYGLMKYFFVILTMGLDFVALYYVTNFLVNYFEKKNEGEILKPKSK